MTEQPIFVMIILTLAGIWTLYYGVRVGIIKCDNGIYSILWGVCVVIAGLFMIRHGNLVPSLSNILEPFLALVWTLLVEVYGFIERVYRRVISFDVETLSR